MMQITTPQMNFNTLLFLEITNTKYYRRYCFIASFKLTSSPGIDISSGTISNTGDNDNDSINELQTISILGSDISLSNGGGRSPSLQLLQLMEVKPLLIKVLMLPLLVQVLLLTPYVVNNAFTEVDGSITNELSDLSLNAGGVLTLSNPATGGNSVTLPTTDGSETIINQVLILPLLAQVLLLTLML